MNVSYFYCHACGYEDIDLFVAYSRATADGEHCLCPDCGKESSDFVKDE